MSLVPQSQQAQASSDASQQKRSVFYPPLSIQRYCWIQDFINDDPSITSVTDVGCGNGRMVVWLKSVEHLQHINCIDKDFTTLESEMDYYMRPNLMEMVFGRRDSTRELAIDVYQGDIAVPDDRLGADCFTMVEMIEHMTLDQVEQVARTVFGFYQPRFIVITTPNKEFNHLLRQKDESPDSFRHSDHKFEWTRAEFFEWAQSIGSIYNYRVFFDGVGHLPNSEPYGPCTQIALFKRSFEPVTANEECLDLLVNKLNVEVDRPEFLGDRDLKKICLLSKFKIPGANPHVLEQRQTETLWQSDDDIEHTND